MRILHVIRGLANSSGTTHIVTPLAEAQARLGHRVAVFHVRKGDRALVEPDPALVESVCFAETVRTNHVGLSLEFARGLARRLDGFDVVHVHAVWNFPTWWTMRRALRAGVPCMVAPQGSIDPWAFAHGHPLRRWYARFAEKPLLGRVARLQALTARECEQFREFGLGNEVVVIPNGVSEDWLEARREPFEGIARLRSGARTLLFLSRLHPKKGLDILLHAFASVRDELEDTVLLVAGHDAGSGYGARMRELVAALGLGEQVLFLGEVAGERKRALLRGVDAFALASHSEGLPVAVVEAMASATPVLITPGCNLPEVATADAGLIVEPEAKSVARGIRSLFEDPSRMRARGENGRELVRERFTWPIIARRTIEVYGEMVEA